jgi:hypothetical protein
MEIRSAEGTPTRINPRHDGDVAFWARLLDASPDELRRAIDCAGSEIAAVRSFLSERQLHLDFDGFSRGGCRQ